MVVTIMSNILEVDRLKKTYGKGDSRTEALKGIPFDTGFGIRLVFHL